MEFVFSAAPANQPPHQAKKPPDPTKTPIHKPSFREKLMGSAQEIPARHKEDMIEKKLVRIELENGNRLLPKVHLEPQVFQELCTPWKDALVVKLLGRNLGYNTMKERLQRVWKLQGGFEIMDNDNGFYMVKLDLAADREKIITGGPWLIYDHCLAVSQWSPEFASPNATVERTMVWIRFPGLNLVYYDESFLLAMASAIGRPVKVDTNTLKVERGRFARVCVEVDLTVPVVGKIWVSGHWYKVQYEGLHLVCTNCGCYGHLGRNCNRQNAPITSTNIPTPTPTSGQPQPINLDPQPSNTDPKNSAPTQAPAVTTPVPIISNNDGIDELHGDWLLVTRRKKKPINMPTPPSPKSANHKNKFMALSPMAHTPKINQHQNFPPRPKSHEIPRSNISNTDPKRRRQSDDPIILPTPPATTLVPTKPDTAKNTNITPTNHVSSIDQGPHPIKQNPPNHHTPHVPRDQNSNQEHNHENVTVHSNEAPEKQI
ncbi:zinc ion binding / nucleic acid binding protein [Trifolium repens]|nr:zinc ion binding / nucleic acid binding protein [Trifolium repens]